MSNLASSTTDTAQALQAHGVRTLFTLCGGHISPILAAAKARGLRIVDVRDEVTAVFSVILVLLIRPRREWEEIP